MDALTAIEGNGPARGYPVKMDLIITSNNPISCDLVALKIIGFDINEVGHVLLAKNLNQGAEGYILTGENIEKVKRNFIKPYDDLVNKVQKYILRHKILIKLTFDSPINKIFFKLAKIYRNWSLRGKTEYT